MLRCLSSSGCKWKLGKYKGKVCMTSDESKPSASVATSRDSPNFPMDP